MAPGLFLSTTPRIPESLAETRLPPLLPQRGVPIPPLWPKHAEDERVADRPRGSESEPLPAGHGAKERQGSEEEDEGLGGAGPASSENPAPPGRPPKGWAL